MNSILRKSIVSSLSIALALSMSLPGHAVKASSLHPNQQPSATITESILESPSTQNEDAIAEPSLSLEQIAKKAADSICQSYGVTSMQFAIMDNGKLILTSGAGYKDADKKTAPTSNTMYGVGSVSKMYTTVAVMQLVEQGKIDLDKPVTTYIPEFKMADSRYKDITVKMLLNHSIGLLGSSYANNMMLNDKSTYAHDEFLHILSTEYLKHKPGVTASYCNDGFTLAEILIEKVTHMTFTQYLEKNICKPLGLTRTKTPLSKFNSSSLANAYLNKTVLPYETVGCIGAGGIYATATELCSFGNCFTKNSDKLLSASSKLAMANKECKNFF